ncbi:proteasome subunit alpha type-1-like [Dendronephthya gigantea]|uniref:proteasome subunit alpha type-1-like n=1 Tax=Dendronephthya gigantea TaxID=151771 RepID=UPI0010697E94|nr:proteasome subunit alpha type-1-like [Dendronephthya gigantea]
MFRNQYDNDVSIWSPQGRIHQIEYAMEAVKQGSATIGIKSSTHVVLVALKRAASELSAHQKKIIPIDDHIGISIAGLTADARLLSKFMRIECLDSKFIYDTPLPVARLVGAIGDKMQQQTQMYGRRPYGVGLLIAGYDDAGPHLYQTCPSANFFDCKCMAIGARSQSARTYLEKMLDEFPNCTPEELIKHGLTALRETLPNEQELTTKNSSVCLVGKDNVLEIFNDEAVEPYLALLDNLKGGRAGREEAKDEAGEPGAEASMEQDPAGGTGVSEDKDMDTA